MLEVHLHRRGSELPGIAEGEGESEDDFAEHSVDVKGVVVFRL